MKRITNLEIGTLSYFLMRSFFVAICFNSLLTIAKQDSYISVFIGILMGFIPLLCFYILFNYESSLNIFDKFTKLFGKIIGNFINLVLIIFFFTLSLITFINLITFIYSQYLDKTPTILIAIMFGICILYCLYKGINTTLRTCIIFFIFSLIIYLISAVGLVFKIDLNNFKPVGIHNYFRGSFLYLSYNVLPLYLLLLIPKDKVIKNKKTTITILIFYLVASFSIILTVLAVLGNFGIKLSLLYDYPEFQVLKYVYVTGISSRVDSLLFIQWMFDMLIFIIFTLHFVSRGIIHFRKIKKSIIYIILSCLLILFNEKLFKILLIDKISIAILSNIIFIVIVSILLLSMIMLLFKPNEISGTTTSK